MSTHRYARVERERRFLLAGPPPMAAVTAVRLISDRYLPGTRLRLRRVHRLDDDSHEYKLTQKVPAPNARDAVQGFITNTYLTADEYDVLAALPARTLTKTRLSVPPFGVDLFDPPLDGLVLAEAEFDTDDDAAALAPPAGSIAEVTHDVRFTGGRLAGTPRAELLGWLAGWGLVPPAGPGTGSAVGGTLDH